MTDAMIRRVLEQFSPWHGALLDPANREFDVTGRSASRSEDRNPRMDASTGSQVSTSLATVGNRPDRAPRATLGAAAAVDPSPFGAQHVNHGIPDRAMVVGHGLRELLGVSRDIISKSFRFAQ